MKIRKCPHKFVPIRWTPDGMIVVQEKCKFCGKVK